MGEPKLHDLPTLRLPDAAYWEQRYREAVRRGDWWRDLFVGSAAAHLILLAREIAKGFGWW